MPRQLKNRRYVDMMELWWISTKMQDWSVRAIQINNRSNLTLVINTKQEISLENLHNTRSWNMVQWEIITDILCWKDKHGWLRKDISLNNKLWRGRKCNYHIVKKKKKKVNPPNTCIHLKHIKVINNLFFYKKQITNKVINNFKRPYDGHGLKLKNINV